MLSFSPTSALSSVDLPTLGRPTSAAKPQRSGFDCRHRGCSRDCSCCSTLSAASCSARRRLEPLPCGAQLERCHLAGQPENLRVGLALDALDAYSGGKREAARLQILLQARLRILERSSAGSAAMRASNSCSMMRRAASSPPSRNRAPHSASSASARMDCGGSRPILSSPEPMRKRRPDRQGGRHFRQRLAAHDPRPQAAQIPLRRLREAAVEMLGDHQVEHRSRRGIPVARCWPPRRCGG